MKGQLIVAVFMFSAPIVHANSNCTDEMKNYLSQLAPKTGKLKITGKYANAGLNAQTRNCWVALSQSGERLLPEFTPDSFNPQNGAGGGVFWPFGIYPTLEIPTNEYEKLKSYNCSVSENGFGMDYSYQSLTDWKKSSHYSLKLTKNSDESYSISLRIDKDGENAGITTCRGQIKEISNNY